MNLRCTVVVSAPKVPNELQPNWQPGSGVSGGDDEYREAKMRQLPRRRGTR